MFKNYLTIAIRNLFKHKLYTGINIFGLAFALSVCFATLGQIVYDMSFEDFQENKDNLYRVESDYAFEDSQYKQAVFSPVFAKTIVAEIPEIRAASVFRQNQIKSIKVNEMRFRVVDPNAGEMHSHGNKLFFADGNYFNLFTFPLTQGDPDNVLKDPNTIIISESAAAKYFPNQNPVGEMITINDTYECHITGILKDTPYNTQQHTDYIISYSTLAGMEEDFDSWSHRSTDLVYLELGDDADYQAVGAKIEDIKNQYFPEEARVKCSMYLIPFNDLMFRGFPGARGELNPRGEMSVIIAFALVAGFILLIAIGNFVNLSTAKSADRIKEVGVRKVMGADRKHLIYQFLGESILISIVAAILGLFLYEMLKSYLEPSLPRQMMVNFYESPIMLVGTLLLMILVGIMAGAYPAIYLSRFNPITVLQRKTGTKSTRSLLRKSMVVFQFATAAVFVFTTYVIYQQTSLITSAELGYEIENVLLLNYDGDDASDKCQLMKNEILNKTGALAATAVSDPPGKRKRQYYEGDVYSFHTTEERQNEDRVRLKLFDADYDFVSFNGLELIEGRGFSSDRPEDINHALLINESAAKELEVNNLIGYRFYSKDDFFEVVGVVKDFQGTPLNWAHKSINTIRLNPDRTRTLMVKLPDGDNKPMVASIKNIWGTILPEEQFESAYLAHEIDRNYEDLRGQTAMFLFFCFASIGIACLGIVGLVSFTAHQRTKEIGIRKVMGASVRNIVILLSREFILLIVIASAIAWPIAYLMTNDLISYYPIRTSIGFDVFLVTALISLLLAMVSAGSQAYKAARANPSDILRSD